MNKQKLQAIELDMLEHVDSICESLGIRYFLVGGTLLGAVRHKGFIPWDDDIDIGMLRADYEIFINKANDLLPDYLTLQNAKIDSDFPYNFSKIRNNNTTYIETSVKKLDINHGVFIDVFPFDFYPEGRVRDRIVDFLWNFTSQRFFSVFSLKKRKNDFIRRLLNLVSMLFFPNYRHAVRVRDKIISLQKKSGLVKNYSGAWGRKEIVPAEWFSDFCKLEFEGHMFWAPHEFDKYLTRIYGNYMELPPIEKRVTHHFTEVIDLENPYTKYLNGDAK